MTNIQASGKYVRITPRKMVQIAKGIKALSPVQAVGNLEFLHKNGAREMQNIIESVLANARMQNIDVETLKFKDIIVTPAGAMKRFQAVSRGMAHSYKKRMSHISVILTAKPIKSEPKQVLKVEQSLGLKFKNQNPKLKIN